MPRYDYLTARRARRQQQRRADAGFGSKKTSATSERSVREPPFSFLRASETGRKTFEWKYHVEVRERHRGPKR